MGKEQTLSGVQCFDCLHFLIGQSKVEYIDIFLHPVFMDRFRNHNYITLEKKTQGHLCRAFFVFCTDFFQKRCVEEIIFPLCKWPPARNLGMVFGQIFPGGLLLLEYVGLYLVDSRFDFCKMGKVKISIRVEIGNADGT